jgi:hypothetical protein
MNDLLSAAQQWLDGMPGFYQELVERSNRVTNRDILVHYRTHRGALYLMFDSVPDELRPPAALTSALCIVIACYTDYWADTVPRPDLIEEARDHIIAGRPIRSPEIAEIPAMWRAYLATVAAGPNFTDFRSALMEEWNTLFDAKLHAILINTDDAATHDYRTAMDKLKGNMLGGHKHVVDIIHSPGWDTSWTPTALVLARKMSAIVRIGNCLKSWRQEVALHRDISSTVCATALEHGVVDRAQLKHGDPQQAIALIETTRIPSIGDLTATEFLQQEQLDMLEDAERLEGVVFTDLGRYTGALRTVISDQMKGAAERR